MRPHPRSNARGFTLLEMVLVIAMSGVLAAVVSLFIVAPVQGYLSTVARTQLVDSADGALRRIARDLRISLPNSTRVTASGRSIELIPASGAARYKTEGSDHLDFGTVDTGFDLIGPGLALGSSQQLVFYNLGPGVTGSDAYAANASATEQASSNRRTATTAAGTATSIAMNSLAGLPVGDFAPPYRVFAVDAPVTYRCDLSAGTLARLTGYGFLATQPDPPGSGSSTVLATGVTACRFSYDAAVVATRSGLVNLQLTLATTTTAGTESITLSHAVHVDNLP